MVSWLMTIKAVLISSGVASVGLLLKFSVPLAVSQAPILWSSLLSWLKPPYLYVLTNGIIITIVVSSKYYRSTGHHHEHDDDGIVYGGGSVDYKIQTVEPIVHDHAPPRMLEVEDLESDAQLPEAVTEVVYDYHEDEAEEGKIIEAVAMVEREDEIESELKSVIMVEDHVMLPPADLKRNHLPLKMTESENLPPAESRFHRRKSVKEGGRAVLRVRKPKENETLENTWKMITEGKSTPLTKTLYRRSDTFTRGDSGDSGEARPVFKKSDTFRDRTNYYQSQAKKEPSLSQDELNRRVEAFIKKFDEDMKLQRMESLRQYKEITGRAN